MALTLLTGLQATDFRAAQLTYTHSSQQHQTSSPALSSSPAVRAGRRNGKNKAQRSAYLGSKDAQKEEEHASPKRNPPFEPSFLAAGSQPSTERANARYVQCIELLSTTELPDRFRSVFPFPNFNAVQSKCFNPVYRTNDNFVLSSPTGSGKTAIFELAICRLINAFPDTQVKIIYQAPTKSLCAERQRDWQVKFKQFDMDCAELTGDTDLSNLRHVQNASIIITTPEKWDSITRKWKDHAKLMQLVKLFLIDEVHVLKEDRGATLEAVVSRMKTVGSDVRFLALSATVPNSEDIAEWLGKDPTNQHLPASKERFGEEFRPVLLQKHVCGYSSNSSDWDLNKTLTTKLPDIIAKYSHKKPMMVFCCTRKETSETARALANWWSTKSARDRYWEAPLHQIAVVNNDLKHCVSAAVAFHHAGLPQSDREAVEAGFLAGNINVICCTSTLAIGVNLPCHFVIIKNTVTYSNDKGLKEYSDLEMMQMLGRAGRPQFDRNAVAVIMTRQEKAQRYELMVSGQEILESCLHRNLIDHLNAEIGLGTIKDLSTARKWLSGTFLCVRMKRNPKYYLLEGDSDSRDVSERLEWICTRDISLLRVHNLIEGDTFLKSTEFGDAMARYCVQFETAKKFLILPPKARLSEILSTVAQAAEFKEIRIRSGEKQLYKDLNKSPMIKFPIHVNLDLPAHKVSLIIQSQLGAVELPINEKNGNNGMQYQTDVNIIFQHVHRLIRCIIDFHLCTEDSIALRNALMLCRSLGAKCWDDSPLTLRQIDGIGPTAVRKLVNANITSFEELANTETQKIEMLLGRRPPFGMELLRKLKDFPALRVDVTTLGRPTIKTNQGASICVKANIGFMNEKPPEVYRGKPVYLVFLAETSDGRKVHFARISSRKVGSGQDIRFPVLLTDPAQLIVCHVMCDELAGTLRSASIKPSNIPPAAWQSIDNDPAFPAENKQTSQINWLSCKNRIQANSFAGPEASEDLSADELGDEDFWQAVVGDDDAELQHRVFHNDTNKTSRKQIAANSEGNFQQHAELEQRKEEEGWQPTRLHNGKWACNHACKDKTKCKHLCCREGQDKPPKPPKKATKRPNTTNGTLEKNSKSKAKDVAKGQTQLTMRSTKDTLSSSPSSDSVSEIDLTQEPKRPVKPSHTYRSRELESLQRLHSTVQRGHTSPNLRNAVASQKNGKHTPEQKDFSTDYRDDWLKVSTTIIRQEEAARMDVPVEFEELKSNANGKFGSGDLSLDAVIVGTADSQDLQPSRTDAGREIGATDELSKVDANMIIAEDLCAPKTMPGHASSVHQTKLLTKHLEQLPTLSEPTNKDNTLIETSSPLFVIDNDKPKRKVDGVELPESPMKKPKKGNVLEPPAKEHSKVSKVSKEGINAAEKSPKANKDVRIGVGKGSSTEGIDPWILREFGKYVQFV